MAAAPPKKKRKATKPVPKEPRKKTAKPKVRPKAPRSDGSTSGELDVFQNESGTKQAQKSKVDDGLGSLTLGMGSSGGEVRRLQQDLIKAGFKLFADGIFGRDTERDIKALQIDIGLESTGIADYDTQTRLSAAVYEISDIPTVKLHAVSDRPLESKEEDALGFAPYVDAMVAFLRSRDTQPPLAMGINAPWGRGKTSFMNMLDSELKNRSSFFGPVRFATEWFNPWKYSDEEQVWAAFVAVITKSVRDALGLWGRLKFEARRFWNNFRQRKFALSIRFLAFAAIGAAFFVVALDPKMKDFSLALVENQWDKTVKDALEGSRVGTFLPFFGGILVAYLLYIKVILQFNITIFDHLKATKFKDKIGTLAQFEKEMQILNECMPERSKLKVIIFVDDLDRCKPQVLWEVIEALQLLAVSQRCTFILGMDLKIVANTISNNYSKLSQEFAQSGDNLQHGWGYQFLEKVIQTRISVPAYGQAELHNLINRTLGPEEPDELSVPKGSEPIEPLPDQPKIVAETKAKQDIPKDSDEVVKTVSRYGSEYFTNPRRLKRFVNNFRLHAYLANITGFEISLDRLARFLVLTEKWPGLVKILNENPDYLDLWHNALKVKGKFAKVELPEPENTDEREIFLLAIQSLNEPQIRDLFVGEAITSKELFEFSSWYGFRYYK